MVGSCTAGGRRPIRTAAERGLTREIYAWPNSASNFYAEGAIVLHFQMRIFLALGGFFGNVEKGKANRAILPFLATYRHHHKPPLCGGRMSHAQSS